MCKKKKKLRGTSIKRNSESSHAYNAKYVITQQHVHKYVTRLLIIIKQIRRKPNPKYYKLSQIGDYSARGMSSKLIHQSF